MQGSQQSRAVLREESPNDNIITQTAIINALTESHYHREELDAVFRTMDTSPGPTPGLCPV